MHWLSKKGLTYVIIELIVAVIAIFIVAEMAAPALSTFIGSPNSDVNSFNDFLGELEAIEPSQSKVLIYPAIDHEGAILFVSGQKKEFSLHHQEATESFSENVVVLDRVLMQAIYNTQGYQTGSRKSYIPQYVRIPAECQEGSCLCLCRNDFVQTGDLNALCKTFDCREMECKSEWKCEQTDLTIPDETIYPYLYPTFFSDTSLDTGLRERASQFKFYNGYFIAYDDLEAKHDQAHLIESFAHPRLLTVHAAKDQSGKLDLCLGRNCFDLRQKPPQSI